MSLLFSIIRYGLVGGGVALAYTFLVVLLVDGVKIATPVQAGVLAFVAVLPISFAMHRSVSFRGAARDHLQGYRFVLVAISSFLIAIGGMYLVTDVFKLHHGFGLALGWVLIPISNYVINALWVFPTSTDVRAADPVPASTMKK